MKGTGKLVRRPCSFKQQDLTRAIRATVAAGISVHRIEIDTDGRIVLVTSTKAREEEELDAELAAFEAKHGRD